MSSKMAIEVPESAVNLLQRRGYEYDTRCDIVTRIVSRASSSEELDKGALAYYQRLADESKASFEAAKMSFEELVVKPKVEAEFGAGASFRWRVPRYTEPVCEVEVG